MVYTMRVNLFILIFFILMLLSGHIVLSDEFPEEMRPYLEKGIKGHFKKASYSYEHFVQPGYSGKKEDRR